MIRVVKKSSTSTTPNISDEFLFIIDKNLPVLLKQSTIQISKNELLRFALKVVRQTPELLKCSRLSILRSLLEAFHLGLSPDSSLGEAYIIPYKDEAQLVIGYRGFIKLAKNSGTVEHIEARIVYQKDRFRVEYGTEPKIEHIPSPDDDPGKPIAVYAIAYLKGGHKVFELLWKRDVEKIKNIALQGKKNKEASPWIRFEEEMWKKTAVRKLIKYLSLSPEVSRAATVDEYRESGIEINIIDEDTEQIKEEKQEEKHEEKQEEKQKTEGKQKTEEKQKESQNNQGKKELKIIQHIEQKREE